MNKRLFYLVFGLVLMVLCAYLLNDIIQTIPIASESDSQVGVTTDTTGDFYLAKLFGCLLVGSIGLVLVITNIIGLLSRKNEGK